MPLKGPRLCACGRVVPAGQMCVCASARKAASDAARPSARARGYTSKWSRESKAFLASLGSPLCACGCGRPANMVDHKVAPKGNMTLFWDRTNWQPYNSTCNTRKAIRHEGGFGKPVNRGEKA
ncbi:HNH endonuclease [Mesorhizobium dulcispinae]|uniref:HNH endonuclease n=1 Tax=Mesorhizobium dulcispinae TaxID=3072316 RepID=UPI002A2450F7|nr:HNH endonuclease [Mesorhizobium sp. VK23D]MDX8517965.1 HNH endonuclease [Mesorhizobium sp. VK23D]